MNKNDIDISSISYTNKDFGSIYPEILDLAKQLTNEWDPSNSNESDPGVVLLKEAAFVADHNNYNIDKNILENFLPSATQDISVRNICEMNGYTPRYYTSAIGDVSFNWEQPESESEMQTSFTIPAFTLVVSDADETVSYTQIENLVVNNNGPVSCKFIEGTLQTLVVNNSSIITLEDLDDNRRVYFPESMVAQNRLYVRNYNSEDENRLIQEDDYWVRDNYLLTRPSGTKVFKLDYDSIVGLPYLEFPTDISSIIEDGLVVEYIATSGKNGNINANTLTKILSPTTFYAMGEEEARTTDSFSVFNSGSITNGKDPETINEMYTSFKKIIGTFDTLVTCLDYSNKIYTLEDGDGNPYVSNVYVTDRRNDYNKSINIVTYDKSIGGQGFKSLSIKPCTLNFKESVATEANLPTQNVAPGSLYYVIGSNKLYVNVSTLNDPKWEDANIINLNDFTILSEAMTPYDLVIYALKAFSLAEYNSLTPELAFNKSFTPVNKTILNNAIKDELEFNKCLSHTYNDPDDGDIFIFKNYVPLTIELEPYDKVKPNEEAKILDNIYKAISEEFNPRKLEFGEKLDVDRLKKVIIASDSRLKNAKINPLEYTTVAMLGDSSERSVNEPKYDGSTILVDLIAKNVLAGRLCLFNFDNNFKFDYGQIGDENSITRNIETIESQLHIKLEQSENGDTSETKESISRVDNKYIIKFEDSTSDYNYKYSFKAPNFVDSDNNLKNLSAGASYTLKNNSDKKDKLVIIKRTSSGRDIEIPYESDNNTSYTLTNNTNGDIVNSETDESHSFDIRNNKNIVDVTVDIKNKVYDLGIPNLENYILKENEIIQILNPNYISDTVYSMYVNYKFISDDINSYIPANVDYTLDGNKNEKLVFIYTLDGVETQTILNAGEVVNANFIVYVTENLTSNVATKEWVDKNGISQSGKFKQLTSNQTIATRKLMQTKLDASNIWCYWIVDNNDNVLFKNGATEKILGNNEYFIYTNSSLNELVILGAGTKLNKPIGSDENWWVIKDQSSVTIDSITKYGTSIRDIVPWQKDIDFVMYPMFITEMAVTTLGEGDQISIYGWSNLTEHTDIDSTLQTKYYLDFDWVDCNGTIVYKYASSTEEVTLPKVENFYQIRSRLDINMSSSHPQKLNTSVINSSSDEIIAVERLILDGSTKIESSIGDEKYVQSSEPMFKIGDKDISVNSIGIYAYTLEKNKNYQRTFVIGKASGETTYNFFCDSNGEVLIPLHISGNGVDITLEAISGSDVIKISDYNQGSASVNQMILKGDTSYYIKLDVGSSAKNVSLKFSWSAHSDLTENVSVIVEDIIIIDGMNFEIQPKKIKINEDEIDVFSAVLERMQKIISGSDKPSTKFYYPYTGDNSVLMDNTNFDDANTMWDINNVANIMILPQIDIENSNIKIVNSMKRD